MFMRSKKLQRLFLSITFILVLLLTACDSKENKQADMNNDAQTSSTIESTETSDKSYNKENANSLESADSYPSQETTDSNKNEVTSEPVGTKQITIYTISDTSGEVEVYPALISEDTDLTPELIVDMVTDALADSSIIVDIDKVTEKDDTVIVSFKSGNPPVEGVGSGTETAILDAYAQSLVDNFKDKYPKVIFQLDGKAYSSGHYLFKLDEVYLDGTKTN